jgi:hypothetical protein
MDTLATPSVDDYYQYLAERDLMLPVFAVDVRKSEDVLMLLDVLFQYVGSIGHRVRLSSMTTKDSAQLRKNTASS